MRRKDRLLELIGCLRDGAAHRAEDLSSALGVTQRTIYRDMETLRTSGVPVEGERGVGYRMTLPVTLPPVNLTLDELEALHLGVAVMTEASDPELQAAARSLARKIDEAMPEGRTGPSAAWGLAVFPFADTAAGIRNIPAIRNAIRTRHKLRVVYFSEAGKNDELLIRPLKLDYWGRVWTCAAWCETRRAFRTLRVDRISDLSELSARFADEPGKTLADFPSRESG